MRRESGSKFREEKKTEMQSVAETFITQVSVCAVLNDGGPGQYQPGQTQLG